MRYLILLGSLLVACTDEGIDRYVTIQHGVFGELTASDSGANGTAAVGEPVSVFSRETPATAIATTTSDAHGLYQFELAPGSYEVCAAGAMASKIFDQKNMNCAGPCTFIEVGIDPLRADWALNLSGGWWSVGDHCP